MSTGDEPVLLAHTMGDKDQVGLHFEDSLAHCRQAG